MSKILSHSKADERNYRKTALDNIAKHENVEISTNPPLPKGCRPLTHQVAGHRYGHGRLGIGMLQHLDGSILKPVQPPPRGEKEVAFYRKCFDPNCTDPVLLTLQPFLPKLLGVWDPPRIINSEHLDPPRSYSYLKLEDACRRFRNPSILDIKIGRVSYDPGADVRKMEIESAKYPPLMDLGFQLLGMRISGPSPNEAVFYDKKYGRSLTKDRITEGLNLYLSGNLAWKKYIVKAFVERLGMILSWFESQERYQFYSSSLLFIYEGEFVDGSSDSDEEFIHKYRQMKFPSLHTESYLATVRKFLNVEEKTSQDDKETLNKVEKLKINDEKCNEVENSAASNQQSETNSTDTSQEDVARRLEVRFESMQQRSPNNISSTTQSTGHESGYSSEAESKLSNRRASASVQNEFVTLLNRRIQETARGHLKYRFPPDLVDVRMIDFAHVFEEPKSDNNYLYGLRNVIDHFQQILKTL